VHAKAGQQSLIALADLLPGGHGVIGVGHVHDGPLSQGSEQMRQRLDGLGLEHALGHRFP
jgi:hypothetical protein